MENERKQRLILEQRVLEQETEIEDLKEQLSTVDFTQDEGDRNESSDEELDSDSDDSIDFRIVKKDDEDLKE